MLRELPRKLKLPALELLKRHRWPWPEHKVPCLERIPHWLRKSLWCPIPCEPWWLPADSETAAKRQQNKQCQSTGLQIDLLQGEFSCSILNPREPHSSQRYTWNSSFPRRFASCSQPEVEKETVYFCISRSGVFCPSFRFTRDCDYTIIVTIHLS